MIMYFGNVNRPESDVYTRAEPSKCKLLVVLIVLRRSFVLHTKFAVIRNYVRIIMQ